VGHVTAAVSALVDQASAYLRSLSGPGIPDVLAGLDRWKSGPITNVDPHPNAMVAAHLTTALLNIPGRPGLASAIDAASPFLSWITYDLYDRTAIGEAFATGHAFAPVISEAGPVPAKDFELGLFLIAPHVFYRDHTHAAPELYAPLTGPHGWRYAPGDPLQWTPAHEPVWNEPFRPHAIKAGVVPFLCLYVWTASVNEAASVLAANDWAEIER
jgi:hypothetical protein